MNVVEKAEKALEQLKHLDGSTKYELYYIVNTVCNRFYCCVLYVSTFLTEVMYCKRPQVPWGDVLGH